MKMVSQLTRQAMSRHRLLSAVSYPDTPASPPPVSEPAPLSPQSAAVRPLYAQETASPPPAAAQPLPVPPAPPQIPQQRTVYGELMKKHDRFTERHLNK